MTYPSGHLKLTSLIHKADTSDKWQERKSSFNPANFKTVINTPSLRHIYNWQQVGENIPPTVECLRATYLAVIRNMYNIIVYLAECYNWPYPDNTNTALTHTEPPYPAIVNSTSNHKNIIYQLWHTVSDIKKSAMERKIPLLSLNMVGSSYFLKLFISEYRSSIHLLWVYKKDCKNCPYLQTSDFSTKTKKCLFFSYKIPNLKKKI
jgi:hypothetical protein